jgi:hypothetical protein
VSDRPPIIRQRKSVPPITCPDCGEVFGGRGMHSRYQSHARQHYDAPHIALAARVTGLRLALEQIRGRAGMWFACRALDPAPDADAVLREVLAIADLAAESNRGGARDSA